MDDAVMTSIEVIRLVAEGLGILIAALSVIWALSTKIMHIVRSVDKLSERLGDEKDPKPGTILARLAHQDACTDSLKMVVQLQGKEAREAMDKQSREHAAAIETTAKETREIAVKLAEEAREVNSKTIEARGQMMERLARVEAKLDIPAKGLKTDGLAEGV